MARRGRTQSLLDGFLVVDKAAGMTSHDVVAIVRRQLNERRVGHAGTLDPDATGVLVVAVGRSTRLMRFVSGADKAYSAEVVFGSTTSSLDASGEVTGRFDMSGLTLGEIQAAATGLTGNIEQVPPMVSAIKIDGRRLYELAREGQEVERAARAVEVTRFDVAPTDDPMVVAVDIECSSGTYVRSLAADLGTALGGGAHLRNLRRNRVAGFGLAGAVDATTVTASALRPPLELLSGMERVEMDGATLELVQHGRSLEATLLDATRSPGPFALLSESGDLVAVYERGSGDQVRPILVHAVSDTGPGSLERSGDE